MILSKDFNVNAGYPTFVDMIGFTLFCFKKTKTKVLLLLDGYTAGFLGICDYSKISKKGEKNNNCV